MKRRVDWIQLGILLCTIIGHALWTEGRIASVERAIADQQNTLAQIQSQLNKLDDKVAEWSAIQRRYQTTP